MHTLRCALVTWIDILERKKNFQSRLQDKDECEKRKFREN